MVPWLALGWWSLGPVMKIWVSFSNMVGNWLETGNSLVPNTANLYFFWLDLISLVVTEYLLKVILVQRLVVAGTQYCKLPNDPHWPLLLPLTSSSPPVNESWRNKERPGGKDAEKEDGGGRVILLEYVFLHLLAPSGALVVMMVYYISIRSTHFFRF